MKIQIGTADIISDTTIDEKFELVDELIDNLTQVTAVGDRLAKNLAVSVENLAQEGWFSPEDRWKMFEALDIEWMLEPAFAAVAAEVIPRQMDPEQKVQTLQQAISPQIASFDPKTQTLKQVSGVQQTTFLALLMLHNALWMSAVDHEGDDLWEKSVEKLKEIASRFLQEFSVSYAYNDESD